jgi:hypothetical protein
MKVTIKWTIIYIFMVAITALYVDNKDIAILCYMLSFWLSIICEFLEIKNRRDELQDSKGREDSEGVH